METQSIIPLESKVWAISSLHKAFTLSLNFVQSIGFDNFVFFGKNAVYLYFYQIVKPIWNSFFVREVPVQTEHGAIKYLANTVSGEDIEFYLNQVTVLKELVDRFIHCTITAVPDGS